MNNGMRIDISVPSGLCGKDMPITWLKEPSVNAALAARMDRRIILHNSVVEDGESVE